MIITLEMTPRERYLVYSALLTARNELKGEHGYQELIYKVSNLPCGEPGCSYCDPNYDDREYNLKEDNP